MSKKSLPNVDEKIIDTVDVDGTYQAELRKKKSDERIHQNLCCMIVE